jgi:hypothetical protein
MINNAIMMISLMLIYLNKKRYNKKKSPQIPHNRSIGNLDLEEKEIINKCLKEMKALNKL